MPVEMRQNILSKLALISNLKSSSLIYPFYGFIVSFILYKGKLTFKIKLSFLTKLGSPKSVAFLFFVYFIMKLSIN